MRMPFSPIPTKGVEQDIDPMLDPVMEKQFIVKGKKMSVNVSDKLMDFDPKFMMYFITRLPNPSFSPELQAKVRRRIAGPGIMYD